ncbi:MAG: citrate lyase subunit beta / citryl-CoA lyase [Actinomycetota bacterium]|nr:citrate lyase subunit beta / citryl-CoA lyase [Actinomycetota bacterium]
MRPPTWLYVPAPKLPELLAKAAASADAVVIDLEDAVHPDHRPAARRLLQECLTELDVPVDVRINAVGSPDFYLDLEALGPVASLLSGVRIPKVETPAEAQAAASALVGLFDGPRLVCQLESARGVSQALGIAAVAGVQSVMLGEADLRADLGVPRDDDAGLALARQAVVLASRAAGLERPIGSVYANIDDDEGLRRSSILLRSFGFHGRSCIHPRQVPIVRDVFTPSAVDLAWAADVVSASLELGEESSAAVKLADGSFVDPAIIRQASEILGHRQVQG